MKEEDKLIYKAKEGEAQAFGKLYDQYMPAIYRFIFFRVGGRKSDAEDLSHQVFLSAWQNIKRYEFQGFPFSSWLYRIAHNAIIDYYRTSKSHLAIENIPEEISAENSDIEEKLDRDLKLKLVKSALTELEPDQQNVGLMKFVNDLSNKEIATALDKSEGAIRVIQHRALKQLKGIIENGENHNTTII